MFYNWNVIGHEKELVLLEKDLLNSTIHHAYLFVGPEKIGKFRVAKAITQILQCPNNFCHTCLTCIQIEKKCHPDTIEFEDDDASVKLQTVRDIISRLHMTGQSRYKICLIQNVGRLTEEAANCLLKTIEEPPPRTVFFFSANQLRDVLPTIASRMRIIHFKKLSDAVLKDSLKKQFPEADEEIIDQAILLSLGRSGRAIQLLTNPETFQELRELYRKIQLLQEEVSVSHRLLSIRELAADSAKINLFLSLLTHYLRRRLLSQSSDEIRRRALRCIEVIHEAMNSLNYNVNPSLLLEYIMIHL